MDNIGHVAHEHGLVADLNMLIQQQVYARLFYMNAKKHVSYIRSGDHLSKFKGRGIDFDEVRPYQAGDDIRHMDWRVTARTGVPHTKLYREERERPIFFLIDYCQTMHFGTKVTFKSVIAAKVAALLSWSGLAYGDRIGGLIFSGGEHIELRPTGGRRGVLRLLNHLSNPNYLENNQVKAGAFSKTLLKLRHVAKPGSIIYVISDFNNLDEEMEGHFSRLSQHHELLNIMIYDPIEKTTPPAGFYDYSDGKSAIKLNTADANIKTQYEAMFKQKQARLENLFEQYGIRNFQLSTEDDIVEKLHFVLLQLGQGER